MEERRRGEEKRYYPFILPGKTLLLNYETPRLQMQIFKNQEVAKVKLTSSFFPCVLVCGEVLFLFGGIFASFSAHS